MSGVSNGNGELRPLRIWLVEDNPDDQELARLAFDRLDCAVDLRLCDDGAEALEALRALGAAGEPEPDLALVDVSMPRMDGPAMVRLLREDPALQRIPVVMFTTSTAQRDIDASHEAGCNAYVVKPYSLTGLVDVLGRTVGFWRMVSRQG